MKIGTLQQTDHMHYYYAKLGEQGYQKMICFVILHQFWMMQYYSNILKCCSGLD